MARLSPPNPAKLDVLLTHSNHVFSDPKQVEKMQPYPPLQTLLAASVLRDAGFTVGLYDVTLQPPGQLDEILRDRRPELVIVCEDDFNFLTKMCLLRNRELAFSMAAVARRHGCRTAVHGSDASDRARDYLHAGFQYVLVGEVETTLLQLVSGNSTADIPGLAYLNESTGRVQYNPPRPLLKELDTLPAPAWELVDIDRYRRAWKRAHGYFCLNMVSSRGCPYSCNWCAKPIYGNRYHVHSPRRVAEEMLGIKQRFAPDRIWFADDIFALSANWTLEFAGAVENLGAQIPFKMQSRCDLMTRDTVSALKRAGCREVWMGAESGSQRILDAMDKGIHVSQIYRACENLRKHGIIVGLFLQLGYRGETWEDIDATVRMVRATAPDDIGISVSYPLPGTKFYQVVAAEMKGKSNWSDSGDLTMMFRGAYSTQFYRTLADALHLEVRQPNSTDAIRDTWKRVYEMESASRCTAGVA